MCRIPVNDRIARAITGADRAESATMAQPCSVSAAVMDRLATMAVGSTLNAVTIISRMVLLPQDMNGAAATTARVSSISHRGGRPEISRISSPAALPARVGRTSCTEAARAIP